MKIEPKSSNEVIIEANGYNATIHEGAYLRIFITKDEKEIASIKVTEYGIRVTEPEVLLKEVKEFVCPHCGQEPVEKNGNVVIGGKIGYKFTLLMVNDKIHKAIFMCDNCEEMFQIPTSQFIRIVK